MAMVVFNVDVIDRPLKRSCQIGLQGFMLQGHAHMCLVMHAIRIKFRCLTFGSVISSSLVTSSAVHVLDVRWHDLGIAASSFDACLLKSGASKSDGLNDVRVG